MYVKNGELHLVWCIDDVLQQAKDDGVEITEDQADEVLHLLLDWHDCNNGTTWDDISQAIEEVKGDCDG